MEELTNIELLILIPFIFIGMFFVGLGYLIRYLMRKKLYRCSERASGKVVDFDSYRVRMSRCLEKNYYRPIIEFVVGKEMIHTISLNGTTAKPYHLGEDILIYYNPNQPDEIIIRQEYEKGMRKTFLVCVIMGLGIPVFGAILGQLVFMLMDALM